MKKNFFSLLIILCAFVQVSYCQDSLQTIKKGTAKIIFMRSTGYNGSLSAFTTFIDDQLVCRLNNKRFSTHTVTAGEHTVSVQFAGKGSKEKAERIKIKTDEGKTYYVQLIFQPGFVRNNLYCQEVTENSANLILAKLTEDTKCLQRSE